MEIGVRVSGHRDLTRLAARLRTAADGGLQRGLASSLQRAAPPALVAVKAAWLRVDVTSTRGGGRSSGLRARVAAATRATAIPGGLRVEVEARAVDPAYGGSLARGLNGMGRWRHPVFGRPDGWEQQYGQEVFYSTLRRLGAEWETGLGRVVTQVAREIEG